LLSLLSVVAESGPIKWAELGLSPGIPIGSFTLRFYSLAYIAGIALGYWHLTRMVKAPGAPMAQRHAEDLFFYCTLGIILGGRLGYAIFYEPNMFTGWDGSQFVAWRLLRLWDGGMSFHGGVLGTLAAVGFVAWRNKLSFIRVADYIAVCVPFGMFFGRLANFVNGELWGRPAGEGVPWAMVFPGGGEIARHPSQLYEAALEGALLVLVMLLVFWKSRARYRPGLLVGLFTAGIATARFVVEFFREPDAQLAEFARESGLNMGQWLSLPLIVAGLAVIAWSLVNKPLASVTKSAAKPAAK
jgi:phosphatidylglycerol---prolipoprotein diacylglyceryl transferase